MDEYVRSVKDWSVEKRAVIELISCMSPQVFIILGELPRPL